MYYPTKRIIGSNVDSEEKMKILVSFRDCLLNSAKERKNELARMKKEIKDKLLQSLRFEVSNTENGMMAKGTITDNVVYYICGYLIHKYRKYSCKNCLATINLDPDLLPEDLTVERLTLLKTKGRLKLASHDFFRLISHVEYTLQEYCLLDDILQKDAFDSVLMNVSENDLPKVGCAEHSGTFVVNAIYDYLLLRFKSIADSSSRKKQEKVDALAAQRHANRKMSKIVEIKTVKPKEKKK